jgi:hypothetical protein
MASGIISPPIIYIMAPAPTLIKKGKTIEKLEQLERLTELQEAQQFQKAIQVVLILVCYFQA